MADNLIKWIEPVRQRRIDFERDPRQVLEYLDTGSKRARMVAQQTMDRVREAVFHWSEKRAEIGGPPRGGKTPPTPPIRRRGATGPAQDPGARSTPPPPPRRAERGDRGLFV